MVLTPKQAEAFFLTWRLVTDANDKSRKKMNSFDTYMTRIWQISDALPDLGYSPRPDDWMIFFGTSLTRIWHVNKH